MRADKGRTRSYTIGEKVWRPEPLIPYGTSTMSDEEFWGRVEETARLLDERRVQKGTGARAGR